MITDPHLYKLALLVLEEEDLENLWVGVCKELYDPKYAKRTHGKTSTYNAGCHGPWCLDEINRANQVRRERPRTQLATIKSLVIQHMVRNARKEFESLVSEMMRI